MSLDKIPVRVSVSEASRLFGVSTKLVRDAIKNQEIRYIVVKKRYKINFESLVQWSQKSVRRSNKLMQHGVGQYVETWRIRAAKYSPRPPQREKT
ncbi:MAG: hypothetical protein A3B31_02310 [Candidatus Komeilibacteria bacterium RIFCSPLOWO2_01_FULL_53_11]|uniref:Helix-turn-helix domain-containing protein n=1 Tax=Candidatus Komeilibacteria bacterium RIFCSPLOWO2_01_FULL_53_11 TaxID=1798552 RepID=A0A1G2BQJ4_9BACT|nr:MAG: hypothetical protein A3B31_02310 [Candidatus Komeilibacteria bacterium RIFCSPLOWO2_01_FULL_53_11]